jgi:hypothetical protein
MSLKARVALGSPAPAFRGTMSLFRTGVAVVANGLDARAYGLSTYSTTDQSWSDCHTRR